MNTDTPFLARRWLGEAYGLTAILPTIPGNGAMECVTYDIPGQHGTGLPFLAMAATCPASPEETETLRKELRLIGYPFPTAYKRLSQRMHRERRDNWRRMLDSLARQENHLPLITSEEIPA